MKRQKSSFTTFNNLPGPKQEKILRVAITEFSEQGYSKASCNRIVKGASISKGSLFQYFGSKEDLYRYICERFIRKVKETVKQSSPIPLDFFELLRGVLISGIRFIDIYPEYFQLYLKIMFEQDVPGRHNFLSKVRLFSSDYFGEACELAIANGRIRADLSVEMIMFSLDAILDKFFLSYAGHGVTGLNLSGLKHDELVNKIDELVSITESGLKNSA